MSANESYSHHHPFNNNGQSMGACQTCGDAITTHRMVIVPVVHPMPDEALLTAEVTALKAHVEKFLQLLAEKR